MKDFVNVRIWKTEYEELMKYNNEFTEYAVVMYCNETGHLIFSHMIYDNDFIDGGHLNYGWLVIKTEHINFIPFG